MLIAKNDLRHIRVLALHHSCISLLRESGIPMKQIKEQLGRCNFSTTATIYVPLNYNSKLYSADAIENDLSGTAEPIS